MIVAVLGGSVAHHFSFDGAAALESELKAYPRFANKEIVLVRLAANGYKQPQQLMALSYLLALGAEIDIAINLDGFNEVALAPCYNLTNGVCPIYPINWHLWVAEVPNPARRLRLGKIGLLYHQRQSWARAFTRVPLCGSVTGQLLWKLRDRSLASAQARETLALQRAPTAGTPDCATGPAYPAADEEELYQDLAGTWKRCSEQLDRLCRANGIAYYHFLQPNQYVAASKPMSSAERRIAYLDENPYRTGVEKGYPLLIRAGRLAREGVRFRDLTMAFAAWQDPLYADTCCHVNATGSEILRARLRRPFCKPTSHRNSVRETPSGDGHGAVTLRTRWLLLSAM